MPPTYKDLAKSTAAGARSIGGPSLTLATGGGALFGSPSPEAPMRVAVHRPNANPAVAPAFVTLLKAVGVTGDVLTIDGAMDGHADAAVNVNDIVINSISSGDMLDVYAAIEAIALTPGPQGDPGDPGADGAPGSVWRDGSGAPSDATGIDGDFYLNTANGDVYQRASGTYGIVANIKGPTGATGSAGGTGSTGATGPAGVGSFGLSMPVGFTVSNSPLTASGTLTVSTALSGVLKASAGGFANAVAGTDYVSPAGLTTALAGYVDITSAQSITGVKTFSAATLVIGTTTVTTTGTGQTGTTVVSTTGGSLTLEQTGDTFGATRVTFQNRNGANGPIFEAASTTTPLIDMGFRVNPSGTATTRTMRLEGRGGGFVYTGTQAELQIGVPGQTLAALFVGDSSVIVRAGLAVVSASDGTPTAPLATLDVRGSVRVKRTAVATTPFSVTGVMYYMAISGPASARVINVPSATVPVGQLWVFKDVTGDAATNNITLTPPGGTTIDGATTFVMNQNYQCVRLIYDGGNKFSTI